MLRGHSAVLQLDLRWEHGQLKWHDPETGRHIATYDDQVARAERERAGRAAAEAELQAERAARAALEAQVRELKAQLQRPHS